MYGAFEALAILSPVVTQSQKERLDRTKDLCQGGISLRVAGSSASHERFLRQQNEKHFIHSRLSFNIIPF